MSMEGRDCFECPAHIETYCQGFGKPGGLAIVYDTALRSKQMHKLLKATLKVVGWPDDTPVYQTSAVPCRYGSGSEGKKAVPRAAIRACSEGVLRELASAKPTKLLLLGNAAASMVLGRPARVKNERGRGFWTTLPDGRRVYSIISFAPTRVFLDPELFRDFAYDLHKLHTKHAPEPAPKIDLRVAKDSADVLEMLRLIKDAPRLSMDLETLPPPGRPPEAALHTWEAQVSSFGLGARYAKGEEYDTLACIVPGWLFHKNQIVRERLLEFLETYEGRLVTHNGPQYDYQVLSAIAGRRVYPKHPDDTMLQAYTLDERPSVDEERSESQQRSENQGHSLKTLARVRYDAPDYHFDFDAFNALPHEERPWNKLFAYHGEDLHYTLRLDEDQIPEILEDSPRLMSVYRNITLPAAFAFGEIARNGAYVDLDYFRRVDAELIETIEKEHTQLVEMGNAWLGVDNFNPGSNPQCVKLFYDVWGLKPPEFSSAGSKLQKGKNKRTTERLAMFGHRKGIQRQIDSMQPGPEREELERRRQFLDVFLAWKQRTKAKSTYIDPLFIKTDANGRIHPEILLTGTATGRTSYRGYNLQNIPALTRTTTVMGKVVRDGFVAPDDTWALLEADFSQAELRAGAWLSQDERLLEVYRIGKDFHTTAAAAVFKKPESEVLGYERHAGKFVVFGIFYGRGAVSLCSGWEMDYLEEKGGKRWTVPEAQKFLDAFLNGFPGFKAWQEEQHQKILKDKEIETLTGRKRRIPLIVDRSGASDAMRRAVNMPIQGWTSDICLLAVIRVSNALHEYNQKVGERVAFITHTVHDSINIQCKKTHLADVVELVHNTMPPKELKETIPDAEPGKPLLVPFTVEIKTGTRWGSMADYNKKVAA
jgi:uracil-DNA glycosylase family 4